MIGIRIESTNLLILGIPFLILLLSLSYFIHKRKGNRTNLLRYILFFILGVYLLLLIGVTLFPLDISFETPSYHRNLIINYIPLKSIISDISTIGSTGFSLAFEIKLFVMNIGGNILLLLPLGLFLPVLWKNLRNLKKIFFIGLITSLSIEVFQLIENILFLRFRSVDIDYVIFNVIGIIIGYYLFKITYKSKLDFLINKFQINQK